MSEILDYLYSRFLLRDLLAKVVPGLITLFCIFAVFMRKPLWDLKIIFILPDLALILIIYSISFLAGMLLQFITMRIGLSVIHVWPGGEGVSRTEMSLLRAYKFVRKSASNDHLARVRERYTILKEMSGNFAGAFSVALISILVRYSLYRSPDLQSLYVMVPILALLIYSLRTQNRFHAKEQKLWETFALLETKSNEI